MPAGIFTGIEIYPVVCTTPIVALNRYNNADTIAQSQALASGTRRHVWVPGPERSTKN